MEGPIEGLAPSGVPLPGEVPMDGAEGGAHFVKAKILRLALTLASLAALAAVVGAGVKW
jgi:hypothetical protein